MDASKRLDDLVAPLRDDVVSGASELARTAAGILGRAAESVHADTVPELRRALAHVALRTLDAQPAMAPLITLAARVLEAVSGDDTAEARRSARAAAVDFASGMDARASALAIRAAALLPTRGDILTLSSSSSVTRALLHAWDERRGRVVVLESRPAREGRDTARALARAGVPVLFAVDAAVSVLVQDCAAVLLGADSIGDLGAVNKLGSLAAALAARRADVPVVVVADTTKILPPGFPQHLVDDRPVDQVWQAPRGVAVWNRYFEAVPLDLLTSVVTEDAVLGPEAVEALRSRLRVPDEVREWAENRTGDAPESGPP